MDTTLTPVTRARWSVAKLLRLAPVVEGSARVGFSPTMIVPLGVVLLASTLLYAARRTAVLGAILLTGWLGGAVATHVRMGEPCCTPSPTRKRARVAVSSFHKRGTYSNAFASRCLNCGIAIGTPKGP
jgi:hypothetical protein